MLELLFFPLAERTRGGRVISSTVDSIKHEHRSQASFQRAVTTLNSSSNRKTSHSVGSLASVPNAILAFSPLFRFLLLALSTWMLLVALRPPTSHAGLTASDVIVVVNGKSADSRTLSNHYVHLRNIPSTNVIVLEDVPDAESITVNQFREKILLPILREIERRGLNDHIQCISYSAGFPTAIDITEDLKDIENLPPVITKSASINSLTYLFYQVMRKQANYVSLDANYYVRKDFSRYFTNPAGLATADRWRAIEKARTTREHAKAAEKCVELLKDFPEQFPLAYLAAAEFAADRQFDKALQLLEAAIQLGWYNGTYLQDDVRFSELKTDPKFQILALTLDKTNSSLQPSIGFDSRAFWSPNGIPAANPSHGINYMLSTVLGVVGPGGTTLEQAINALTKNATSDFTHPIGNYYFCLTSDVRTTTRSAGFASAVDSLKALGYQAEILKARLPSRDSRILGLQMGTTEFNLPVAQNVFLPGALAENLTSYSGRMIANNGHTNLSEFVRAGVAGTSGTVTEPYALQDKFPLPQLYVHYARGATMAEAFYMSVAGPYQLLIVGDPLCKPFSHAPQLPSETLKTTETIRKLKSGENFELTIGSSGLDYLDIVHGSEKQANIKEPMRAAYTTLLLDGVKPRRSPAQDKLKIGLGMQFDGYHEITLQLEADDPLRQRSEAVLPLWIGDDGLVDIALSPLPTADSKPSAPQAPTDSLSNRPTRQSVSLASDRLKIYATAPDAKRVAFFHDSEYLGAFSGESGSIDIPIKQLGTGPVRITARAERPNGTAVLSLPLLLEVRP